MQQFLECVVDKQQLKLVCVSEYPLTLFVLLFIYQFNSLLLRVFTGSEGVEAGTAESVQIYF